MRLLLDLEALLDHNYDLLYHNKAQAFIYGLLKDIKYTNLSRKKYKFFCFSNIIPPNNIKRCDKRTFIVSSPDKHIMTILKDSLNKSPYVHIGSIKFKIKNVKELEVVINKRCKLINGTPIVIRIPQVKYKEYNIHEKYNRS